jgi:Domain of unknown function (DUF4331)
MRRPRLSRRTGVVLAAVTASAIAVPIGITSSHREAPNIMLDPSADNTDVYAWTADEAPGAITVAANWIPGQVPANGPNFFRFDDRARYSINFDNTGDGVADVKYRYEFDTEVREPGLVPDGGPEHDRLRVAQPDPDVRRRPRGIQPKREAHRHGRRR